MNFFTFSKFAEILEKFVQNFEVLSQEVLMIDLVDPFFQTKLMNGHINNSPCHSSKTQIYTEKSNFLNLLERGNHAFRSILDLDLITKRQFYNEDTKILKQMLKDGMVPGYPKPAELKHELTRSKMVVNVIGPSIHQTMKFTNHSEMAGHQQSEANPLHMMFSSIHSSMPRTPQRSQTRRNSTAKEHKRPRSKSMCKKEYPIFSFQNQKSPRGLNRAGQQQTSILSNAFSSKFKINFSAAS